MIPSHKRNTEKNRLTKNIFRDKKKINVLKKVVSIKYSSRINIYYMCTYCGCRFFLIITINKMPEILKQIRLIAIQVYCCASTRDCSFKVISIKFVPNCAFTVPVLFKKFNYPFENIFKFA